MSVSECGNIDRQLGHIRTGNSSSTSITASDCSHPMLRLPENPQATGCVDSWLPEQESTSLVHRVSLGVDPFLGCERQVDVLPHHASYPTEQMPRYLVDKDVQARCPMSKSTGCLNSQAGCFGNQPMCNATTAFTSSFFQPSYPRHENNGRSHAVPRSPGITEGRVLDSGPSGHPSWHQQASFPEPHTSHSDNIDALIDSHRKRNASQHFAQASLNLARRQVRSADATAFEVARAGKWKSHQQRDPWVSHDANEIFAEEKAPSYRIFMAGDKELVVTDNKPSTHFVRSSGPDATSLEVCSFDSPRSSSVLLDPMGAPVAAPQQSALPAPSTRPSQIASHELHRKPNEQPRNLLQRPCSHNAANFSVSSFALQLNLNSSSGSDVYPNTESDVSDAACSSSSNGLEPQHSAHVPDEYTHSVSDPLVFNVSPQSALDMQATSFDSSLRPIASQTASLSSMKVALMHRLGRAGVYTASADNEGGGSRPTPSGFERRQMDLVDREESIVRSRTRKHTVTNR